MNYEKIDLLTNNAVEILPSVYSEALSYNDMVGYIVSQLNTVEELVSDLANKVADAPGQAELDAIIVEAGRLAGLAQEYATIATQLAGIASTKAMEASGYATTAGEKATEAAGYAASTYTKTEVDNKYTGIVQRIDNLVATPVPTGEIIAEEIIDARDGEVSVGAKIRSIDTQLAHYIGSSNGVDDTQKINSLLNMNNYVKGTPGEEYIISDTLIIKSESVLDMQGCNVKWKQGVLGKRLLKNESREYERMFTGASITNGTNLLTVSDGDFTQLDVGKTVNIRGASGDDFATTVLTSEIKSVESSTSVTISKLAKNTVTSSMCEIHNRDKNIKVMGGNWDRGDAVGNDAKELHGLDFRHVDALTVDIESYSSSKIGAKYALLIGSVDDVVIKIRHLNTISDGVHINGPANNIDIPFLAGFTGDDFISLTGADYPHYSDTSGDITNIKIGRIFCDNPKAVYKILAGAGNKIDNFKADYSVGTTLNYATWVGDDPTYPNTIGGSYGLIDLGNLNIAGKGDIIRLVSAFIDTIKVSPRGSKGGILIHILENGRSGNVNKIVINDLDYKESHPIIYKDGLNTKVNLIEMNNLEFESTANVARLREGVIEKMIISNSRIDYIGPEAPFEFKGGSLVEMQTIDSVIDNTGSQSGAKPVIIQKATSGVSIINLVRSKIIGGGSYGVITFGSKGSPLELRLEKSELIGLRRWVDYHSDDLQVNLDDVVSETVLEPISNTNANSKIYIKGFFKNMIGATTLLTSTSVGDVRVNGSGLPVRLSLLNPKLGDRALNTHPGPESGYYVGEVYFDGTSWRPVKGFVESGTATLANGKVYVGNGKITPSLKVNVYLGVANGTPGAYFVKRFSTFFEINSTSATDNSTVRYDIISY